MKFGRRMHQRQVAGWSDYYIDYDALKRLRKALSPPTEIYAVLLDQIHKVNVFYVQKYDGIYRKWRARNRGQFQPYQEYLHAVDLNHPGQVALKHLDVFQLKQLYAAYFELRAELEKLHWFGHVNHAAVEKVLRKIESIPPTWSRNGESGFSIDSIEQFQKQSQCLEDLDRLKRILAAIIVALEGHPVPGTDFPPSRLCARIIEYFPPSGSSRSTALDMVEEQFQTDLQSSAGLITPPCCEGSLSPLSSLEISNINEYIHNLVVEVGRSRHPIFRNSICDIYSESSRALVIILESLPPNKWDALQMKDSFGRLLIHYAAEFGFEELCRVILKYMKDWGQFSDLTHSIVSPALKDCESSTPLYLSVLGGHVETTKALLKSISVSDMSDATGKLHRADAALGGLLLLSLKSGYVDIAQLLIENGADTNQSTKNGETALCLAAQAGHEKLVELLVAQNTILDSYNATDHRTPLAIAAREGHKSIVEILIKAGADPGKYDLSNWTAIDHAGWRGHLEVVKVLNAHREKLPSVSSDSHLSAKEPRTDRAKVLSTLSAVPRGHAARVGSVIKEESQVIIHLGSWDDYKNAPVLSLSPEISLSAASTLNPLSCFSIGITSNDGDTSNYVVQLPIAEDMTNSPLIFSTADPGQFKLTFDLFYVAPDTKYTNGEKKVLLGSGIALPMCLKQCLGPERESLIRDYTIPILEKKTLKYIAAVTFSFLIAMPFSHSEILPIATDQLWNVGGPTKVIGHRGMGQNTVLPKYPQLGENTIQSYITAVNLGASYVELDVQLTKDYVPVIYHDFLVSETGTDSPMHTLTLDQFMHISHSQSEASHGDLLAVDAMVKCAEKSTSKRIRSRSFNTSDESRTKVFRDRIKHTWDFQNTGYKGNTRGHYIHQPFTTLAEVLQRLPPSMPLDIELKYPMLWEATDWYKMDLYAVEVNLFVDTILSCIFRYASNRPITLCSFSPEVCIILALKQARYPILFGNDSGNYPTGDVRASNLQEAVHFSNRWNLDGLALASEPLVMAPKLIGKIKSHNLVCVSYGELNDDPQKAKIQTEAGLDVLLVNKISLIVKSLKVK